jgi:ribosomal subunit interface protein
MKPTITVRHCDISDALRRRAISVLERLTAIASRPMESSVIFDTDGTEQTVEIRLHVARGEILVARGGGVDHRTALDRAEDKLKRQVERASERPRRVRAAQSNHRR